MVNSNTSIKDNDCLVRREVVSFFFLTISLIAAHLRLLLAVNFSLSFVLKFWSLYKKIGRCEVFFLFMQFSYSSLLLVRTLFYFFEMLYNGKKVELENV